MVWGEQMAVKTGLRGHRRAPRADLPGLGRGCSPKGPGTPGVSWEDMLSFSSRSMIQLSSSGKLDAEGQEGEVRAWQCPACSAVPQGLPG